VNIRQNIFGEIAFRSETGNHVLGIDTAALLERLILFDRVVISTVGLRDLPFLVKCFGKSGLITLLESNILRLTCEWTFILTGVAINGKRSLPLGQFEFGIAEVSDRNASLRPAFKSLQTVSGLKNADRALIEETVLATLVRPQPTFGMDVVYDFEADLGSNSPVLRAAVLYRVGQLGIASKENVPLEFDLKVEEDKPRIFRILNSLEKDLGLSPEESHQVLDRSAAAVAELHKRLAEMMAYSAIPGFADNEAPLLLAKFNGLLAHLDGAPHETQFGRVLDLADVDQPEPISKINVDKLLEARESLECLEFKEWLSGAASLSDFEVVELFGDLRHKIGHVMTSWPGKAMRFVVISAVGLIPGGTAASLGLGLADAFLIDKIFPKSGVTSFLTKTYPSLYRRV
jgi:hypothetical protein